MGTQARSSMQLLHTTVLLMALSWAVAPTHARQLIDGMVGIKAYRIEFNCFYRYVSLRDCTIAQHFH